MTYGYNITGLPNDSSDKYALLPMTYTFSGKTINGAITTTVVNEFDYMYLMVAGDTGHTQIITTLNQQNNQYPQTTLSSMYPQISGQMCPPITTQGQCLF